MCGLVWDLVHVTCFDFVSKKHHKHISGEHHVLDNRFDRFANSVYVETVGHVLSLRLVSEFVGDSAMA